MTSPGPIRSFISGHNVIETMTRLEKAVLARGMTIFARIDFSRDAEKVGMSLDKTMLLIFGNPAAGTLLIQDDPTVALELPLKALIWDADGKTTLGFLDPGSLSLRYQIHGDETVLRMQQALIDIAEEATGAGR